MSITKPYMARTDEEKLFEIASACKVGRGRSSLRWDVNMRGGLLEEYLQIALEDGLIFTRRSNQNDIIYQTTDKGYRFVRMYEGKFG